MDRPAVMPSRMLTVIGFIQKALEPEPTVAATEAVPAAGVAPKPTPPAPTGVRLDSQGRAFVDVPFGVQVANIGMASKQLPITGASCAGRCRGRRRPRRA